MNPIRSLTQILLLALLFGCGGGEHEDIKQWMAESSKDMRGTAPPLPELKPFPVVSYNAAEEQDPFSAGRIEPEKKEGGGKTPDFDRPREQLESFPLESLAYIGLVSKRKDSSRHALIRVEGVVYQASKGNYLGQNFGRIVDITDAEIVVVETVLDPTGQTNDWVERRMTLQLQEGSQGKESK